MSVSACSLEPSNTFFWNQTVKSEGCYKIAYAIVAVVAVPIELIGRLFYYAAMKVAEFFGCRKVEVKEQEEEPLPIPALARRLEEMIHAADGISMQPLSESEVLSRSSGMNYGCAYIGAMRPDFRWMNWMNDQAFLVLRAERAQTLLPSPNGYFAKQLLHWQKAGLDHFSGIRGFTFQSRIDRAIPERDRPPRKLESLVETVIGRSDFLADPQKAALEVWKEGNASVELRPAPNGALLRTCYIGAMFRNNLTKAVEEAIHYAKTTHADPRSSAAVAAGTALLVLLLRGVQLSEAIQNAEEIGSAVLLKEMASVRKTMQGEEKGKWKEIAAKYEAELRQTMHGELASLNISENGKTQYVFKALGAGICALREAERELGVWFFRKSPEAIFQQCLNSIIAQKGDICANATFAGALLGARLGAEGIPSAWMSGLDRQDAALLEESSKLVEEIALRNPRWKASVPRAV